MSNLKGVDITKGRIGANRRNSSDAISGFIISAVLASALAFDTHTTVYNLQDVKNLGITEEYDDANNVNVYRHLSEFYRNAGEGTELHLMLTDQTQTLVSILEDKAQAFIAAGKGDIKQLGIAINLVDGTAITMLDGIPEDVRNGIASAKALEIWADENNMPIDIFLEGYSYGGNAASTIDLRDIENLEAEGVTVVIGQDYNYAQGKTGLAQKYADVGTALGVCSKATVNQNIGNNEIFNLTDGVKNVWVEPGLSSHQKNTEVYSDLQTLEDKGFVFGVTYTGMAGVRFNNDHVCAPIIIDADNKVNEHTIALGRTRKKAERQLRSVYLPKVKTDWLLDEKTGKLSPGTVIALEDIGDNVFADMVKAGEITYGKTTVDPDSDLIVEKSLIVSWVIVPRGNIGEIIGKINLKTQV